MSDTAVPQARANRRLLMVLGIVCGLYGVFCAAVYTVNLSQQPGSDFMVYYTAARAWFDGDLDRLYDGARLTATSTPISRHGWQSR